MQQVFENCQHIVAESPMVLVHFLDQLLLQQMQKEQLREVLGLMTVIALAPSTRRKAATVREPEVEREGAENGALHRRSVRDASVRSGTQIRAASVSSGNSNRRGRECVELRNVTAPARLVTAMSRRKTCLSANVCNTCHGVTGPDPHVPPPRV